MQRKFVQNSADNWQRLADCPKHNFFSPAPRATTLPSTSQSFWWRKDVYSTHTDDFYYFGRAEEMFCMPQCSHRPDGEYGRGMVGSNLQWAHSQTASALRFGHLEFRCACINHTGAIPTHTQKKEEFIQVTLIPSVQQKGVWTVPRHSNKHGKYWTCNYSSPWGQQNHHYSKKIRNHRGVPAQPPSVPRGAKSIATTAMSCLLNYSERTSSVRTSWKDKSYRPNTNV